jgi:hypothetical protein
MALLPAFVPEEATPATILTQAAHEFQQGLEVRGKSPEAAAHFAAARRHYEALLASGTRNSDLCRNAGNAALLAGDLPRAVLAYRRGLRLDPTDRDLLANLAFAREQVAYPETGALARPATDHRPPWLPAISAYIVNITVMALGALAYAFAWLSLTRWLVSRERRRLMQFGIFSLLAGVVITWLAMEQSEQRWQARHPLVVLAEDGVVLRKGCGQTYLPRVSTPLNRGVEARLVFSRGNWLQVELGSGEIGWVPREAVLVDEL